MSNWENKQKNIQGEFEYTLFLEDYRNDRSGGFDNHMDNHGSVYTYKESDSIRPQHTLL